MKNKNNQGSALAMVLVILVFMSYASIMIMSASYENIKISRSYMGDRRMYRGTDYVANLISIRLQKKVKEIQESTKSTIISNIQGLNHLKETYEPYLTKEGALNSEDYDIAFNREYKAKFKTNFEASEYGVATYTTNTKNKLVSNNSVTPTVMDPEPYYKVSLVEGETMY